MAIDVTVVRYAGDKPGDDIFDILLSTEEAAKARGFGELNQQSVIHKEVVVESPYVPSLEMGRIVSAIDSMSQRQLVGRLTGISVRGEKADVEGGSPSLTMNLVLECPSRFSDL